MPMDDIVQRLGAMKSRLESTTPKYYCLLENGKLRVENTKDQRDFVETLTGAGLPYRVVIYEGETDVAECFEEDGAHVRDFRKKNIADKVYFIQLFLTNGALILHSLKAKIERTSSILGNSLQNAIIDLPPDVPPREPKKKVRDFFKAVTNLNLEMEGLFNAEFYT